MKKSIKNRNHREILTQKKKEITKIFLELNAIEDDFESWLITEDLEKSFLEL